MILKDYEITLDLINKTTIPKIEYVQGNYNTSKLVINLTKRGVKVDLTDITVTLECKKYDGTVVSDDNLTIDPTNGRISIIFKTQTIACPGVVVATLSLHGQNGEKLTSCEFSFYVRAAIDNDGIVESTNEFGQLINATFYANAATQSANSATENANTKASLADEKATLADEKATLANEAATNANTKATLANEAATNANTKALLADEKATLANEKATLANEAATNANTKALLADEKATLANNAASAANTAKTNADNATSAANTATINANNAATAANTATLNANNAATAANTSKANIEANESARVIAESNRASVFNTLQSNMANATVNANTALVQINARYEPESKTNTVDGSGRITKTVIKRWPLNTLKHVKDQLNFNVDNLPQTIVEKYYDQNEKGLVKLDHAVTYDSFKNVLTDNAVTSPYESTDLTTTRAGLSINPLNTYNFTGGTATNNNTIEKLAQPSVIPLNNELSSLEVRGSKVLTTFSTGKKEQFQVPEVPFVGGDTQSFTYDFFTKVANSVTECPLKIYQGAVDPNNLQAPTVQVTNIVTNGDFSNGTTGWTTSAATISVVSAEGNMIASSSTGYSLNLINGGTVVGRKYYGKATVKTTSNKVRLQIGGSSSSYHAGNGAYQSLSVISTATTTGHGVAIVDDRTSGWDTVYFDNVVCVDLTAIFGAGNEPDITTCDKIFANYFNGTITHNGIYQEITNQTILDKLKTQNELPITSVNTTTKTAVWNGKNLVLNDSTHPAVVDDFAGKVSGSNVENPNSAKLAYANTLQVPSAFTTEISNTSYSNLSSLNGTCVTPTNSTNGNISQQLFSFNIIEILERKFGTLPCGQTLAEKVAWVKTNISKITANWWGYGVANGVNKAYLKAFDVTTLTWALSSDGSHTSSVVTRLQDINGPSWITKLIDNNGFIHYLAHTDAVSTAGNTATIHTDYINIEINLKAPQGYDMLVPENPRRDSVTNGNVDNIVLVKKTYATQTSDFSGKISGSVAENPNKIYNTMGRNSLASPTDNAAWAEYDTVDIQKVYSQDGQILSRNKNSSGLIQQNLFSFDLIKIFEKTNGTIPATDKVAWVRANINKITANWYGFGSCPSGNKAYLKGWFTNNWVASGLPNTHISSSVSNLIWYSLNIPDTVDINGMCHFIAYTDPSDGVTASVINTDYINLQIEYKTDSNGIEYFTNNSVDIDVQTANKAAAYLVECDLTPIANALFGGSNANLKAGLKAISADIWVMGSGAVNGVLTNGVIVKGWAGQWYEESNNNAKNLTASIAKIIWKLNNNADSQHYATTVNKSYFLVYSQYSSDGTIPSSVNLDFLSIKVDFSRIPDVMPPIPLYLPEKWSMLIKGVSPSWTPDDCKTSRVIVSLCIDSNNRIGIWYSYTDKKIYGTYVLNGTSYNFISSVKSFLKNQIYNLILTKSSAGMKIYILTNNSILETFGTNDNPNLSGNINLKILTDFDNKYGYDSFLDSLTFFPNYIPDDITAEGMLKGTIEGYENGQLLDATLSTTQTINVLPNNRYELKTSVSAIITEYFNATIINSFTVSADSTFITNTRTNKLKIDITGSFNNLSLKRKD